MHLQLTPVGLDKLPESLSVSALRQSQQAPVHASGTYRTAPISALVLSHDDSLPLTRLSEM
jgi:hypothetical protein